MGSGKLKTPLIALAIPMWMSLAHAECETMGPFNTATKDMLNSLVKKPPVCAPYQGCLLFQDDLRAGDDQSFLKSLKPDSLTRSWYRFGEPAPDKKYSVRAKLIQDLKKQKISVGGGASLSVINRYDLARKDFDPSWRSIDLNGAPIEKDGEKFASLSAPGFRSYLVKNLVEQAKLGVNELHLGETNGKIHFDDYSLGIKGGDGFVQWVKKKNPGHDQQWWKDYLGEAGVAIHSGKTVTREMFKNLSGSTLANFQSEWGKPDSWHGTNAKDEPAFLAYAYRKNLESLLGELKKELKKSGRSNVTVDVMGTAQWSGGMSPAPDAVMSAPPDERWGLNWNTDPNFDLEKNRDRIKKLMIDEQKAAAPSTLLYMFDHPKPFLTSFTKLSDTRQAQLTRYFAGICREIGAKFIHRSYSEIPGGPGPETRKVIQEECETARLAK